MGFDEGLTAGLAAGLAAGFVTGATGTVAAARFASLIVGAAVRGGVDGPAVLGVGAPDKAQHDRRRAGVHDAGSGGGALGHDAVRGVAVDEPFTRQAKPRVLEDPLGEHVGLAGDRGDDELGRLRGAPSRRVALEGPMIVVSAANVNAAVARTQTRATTTARGKSAASRTAMLIPSAGRREVSSPYRVNRTTESLC